MRPPMTKRKLRSRIRSKLTNDLRLPKYRGKDRLRGHCYVASEAFFHLAGGKDAGYKPMTVRHECVVHWYLLGPEGVVDLTVDQFDTPVPYHFGRGRGFLTKEPSKRARILMERVNGLQ